MNVGIIGIGVVGGAIRHGFEKLGHNVVIHDVKHKTKIEDVIDTDIVFVCVPTPSAPNKSVQMLQYCKLKTQAMRQR